MLDRSVHLPTQWTVANVAFLPVVHLGQVMSEAAHFQNGSPLTPSGMCPLQMVLIGHRSEDVMRFYSTFNEGASTTFEPYVIKKIMGETQMPIHVSTCI